MNDNDLEKYIELLATVIDSNSRVRSKKPKEDFTYLGEVLETEEKTYNQYVSDSDSEKLKNVSDNVGSILKIIKDEKSDSKKVDEIISALVKERIQYTKMIIERDKLNGMEKSKELKQPGPAKEALEEAVSENKDEHGLTIQQNDKWVKPILEKVVWASEMVRSKTMRLARFNEIVKNMLTIENKISDESKGYSEFMDLIQKLTSDTISDKDYKERIAEATQKIKDMGEEERKEETEKEKGTAKSGESEAYKKQVAEHIKYKWFSYAKDSKSDEEEKREEIEQEREWLDNSESASKYSEVLADYVLAGDSDEKMKKLNDLKNAIRRKYHKYRELIVRAIPGVKFPEITDADAWIIWDIAKQHAEKDKPYGPSESFYPIRVTQTDGAEQEVNNIDFSGSALDDESKMEKEIDTIVARHIGWEFSEMVKNQDIRVDVSKLEGLWRKSGSKRAFKVGDDVTEAASAKIEFEVANNDKPHSWELTMLGYKIEQLVKNILS